MNDAYFLDSNALAAIVGFVGEYVAWGLALAVVVWVLGYGLYFIRDFLRGG